MVDSVLIVDDERGIRETLRAVLEDEGFECETAASGEEGLRAVERRAFGCVLLDVWLPGIDGLETLSRLREAGADCAVVMISGHGNIETAVRATKLGAFDFIEKPLSVEKTLLTVRNAIKQRTLEREHEERAAELQGEYVMIGESVAMRALRKLIESELFGHVRGAFTGATAAKRGKFELADGATLFLDEVGDMSQRVQAKVLRVLEEQRFSPVGSNAQLEVEIDRGSFRPDLFYRLNVIPFEVPPLRDRLEDVPTLVEHFNQKFSRAYGKPPKRFEADAIEALQNY